MTDGADGAARLMAQQGSTDGAAALVQLEFEPIGARLGLDGAARFDRWRSGVSAARISTNRRSLRAVIGCLRKSRAKAQRKLRTRTC